MAASGIASIPRQVITLMGTATAKKAMNGAQTVQVLPYIGTLGTAVDSSRRRSSSV